MYQPLTEKEKIIMMLEIIHNHTERDTEKKLAEIRANVAVKWPATLKQIDDFMARANESGKSAGLVHETTDRFPKLTFNPR